MSDEETQAGSTIKLITGDEVQVDNTPVGIANLMKRNAGSGVVAFKQGSDDEPPLYLALDKIVGWKETASIEMETW